VNFEISVKSKPSRSNQNYFVKSIMFEGLMKEKLELEALRDKLKKFFDHEYKRTFILFPPMVKKPRYHKKPAN
jgi:hypothetical protein